MWEPTIVIEPLCPPNNCDRNILKHDEVINVHLCIMKTLKIFS